jgi:hypothetical protein
MEGNHQQQSSGTDSPGSGTDVVATIGTDSNPPPPVPAAAHGLNLWTVLVAIAGVLVLARLWVKLRNASKVSRKDWDEQEIDRLRKQGYVPFKDYPVDFFLALPDEAACQAVRQQLESQGCTVDVKPMEDSPTLRYSLHAVRLMRLIVPEMEAQTRKLTRLAEQFQGRYDGWSASGDIAGVMISARRGGRFARQPPPV